MHGRHERDRWVYSGQGSKYRTGLWPRSAEKPVLLHVARAETIAVISSDMMSGVATALKEAGSFLSLGSFGREACPSSLAPRVVTIVIPPCSLFSHRSSML
jgi:hypothetical protein